MYNWILVDKATGKIKNSVQTPNEGVFPKISDPELEEVITVSEAEFDEVFAQTKTRYNYSTGQLEPEDIYRFALMTEPPYSVGIIPLVFQQRDPNGADAAVPVDVNVTVNGQAQQVFVDDGTLEVELTCPEPATVKIKIEAERHEALEAEVVISG